MKKQILASLFALAAVTGHAQTEVNIQGTAQHATEFVFITPYSSNSKTDTVKVKRGKWKYKKQIPADVYALIVACDKKDNTEAIAAVMVDNTPTEVHLAEGTVKGSKASEAMNTTIRGILACMKENKHSEAQRQIHQAVFDNLDTMLPVQFVPMMYRSMSLSDLQRVFYAGAPYENHPAMQKAKEYKNSLLRSQSQSPRAIGKKFTDIAINDTTGNKRNLSEWCGKGKYILIDFWASWCGPCRAEMPNVVQSYEKYHEKGLEVIAISFDTNKEAWLRAIKTMKMPWVNLSDLAGWESIGAKTYGIRSIPANILLDGEGKIIATDLRGPALDMKLAEIFGE